MKLTSIQWTNTTVNPTSGCDGCEILEQCYAHKVHVNRLAHSFPANYSKDFLEVRTIGGRMAKAALYGPLSEKETADKPWFVGHARHIFVSDMSDALSKAVTFEYLKTEIIDVVTSPAGRRHVWQWLTKRPERMAEFDQWLAAQGIAWPANLWAGTSATNQRTFDQRVPFLARVRAAVRFVSAEPLKEHLSITPILAAIAPARLHWLLIGGMSGTKDFPFHIGWAASLIAECRKLGVAPFVKQLGRVPMHNVQKERRHSNFAYSNPPWPEVLKLKDPHGGDWAEWPSHLRVRELPTAPAAPAA